VQQKWILPFAVCVAAVATAQGGGRITGIVLNEQGQIVDDAKICLSVTSGNNTSINCRMSAEGGQFHIENVKFGTYELFAINEAEGYSIDNQSPGQKVAVTPANPWPDVTVQLRPAGAALIGKVRDRVTGEPVKGISVQYFDVDGKASGSSLGVSDGEFRVTLPTRCDLVVVVSAKGYHGWVYTDPSSPSRPVLRMDSGQRRTIEIELEPRNDTIE
jgi:hypothetical protein